MLISKGVAKGSMIVQLDNGESHIYDLDGASLYLEKNWGGSFPSRWWWIQANTFFFQSDLCVTSTAGCRKIPLLGDEEVGPIGLHWNGEFLPFPHVGWNVKWGKWEISGHYGDWAVTLAGDCEDNGFPVNCPTAFGMRSIARETFTGTLRVKLYKNGALVLDDYTDEACLEVGGLPWRDRMWQGRSEMKEPFKTVVMNPAIETKVSDLLSFVGNFAEIPGL